MAVFELWPTTVDMPCYPCIGRFMDPYMYPSVFPLTESK